MFLGLIRRRVSASHHSCHTSMCQIELGHARTDGELDWPGLEGYFKHFKRLPHPLRSDEGFSARFADQQLWPERSFRDPLRRAREPNRAVRRDAQRFDRQNPVRCGLHQHRSGDPPIGEPNQSCGHVAGSDAAPWPTGRMPRIRPPPCWRLTMSFCMSPSVAARRRVSIIPRRKQHGHRTPIWPPATGAGARWPRHRLSRGTVPRAPRARGSRGASA